MLNVLFGRDKAPEGYILDTRIYFSQHREASWFDDEFVKRFLKAVEGTEVIRGNVLMDKYGDGLSPENICTGCKTLCSIYYDTEGKWFYGTAMGNNCYPFLMEIARERDVNIFLEHYPDIESKYYEEGLISVDGVVVGEYDFEDCYIDWCEETDNAED